RPIARQLVNATTPTLARVVAHALRGERGPLNALRGVGLVACARVACADAEDCRAVVDMRDHLTAMLIRLVVGLVTGLIVGGLVGFALAKLGFAAPGAIVAYLAAGLAGALVGLIAGKPIWAKDARIEAGMKAIVGALLGA